MRAESADDQDQKDRRRFDKLVEQLGPVKFRRLAGEWCAAHGKGDGESGSSIDMYNNDVGKESAQNS